MRVVDLDRDMSDVIPTGTSLDSEFLFERMTQATLELVGAAPGRRVLDVASGVGQDAAALAARGACVVGAEPSARMSAMAQAFAGGELGVSGASRAPAAAARLPEARPRWVRAWADALPFRSGSFDAVFCKGAIDHFDRPEQAIAEMARVARPEGRVVLAIANFESFACRYARFLDELDQDWLGRPFVRGRRGYDCPSDHFTRYELELMQEQARRSLDLEVVRGVSLGWGAPRWAGVLARLPRGVGWRVLQALDACARRWPVLADVVVIAGRPRRSAITSS